jgi:hypothetical protein
MILSIWRRPTTLWASHIICEKRERLEGRQKTWPIFEPVQCLACRHLPAENINFAEVFIRLCAQLPFRLHPLRQSNTIIGKRFRTRGKR